jgi:hypothetical protein
MLGANFAYVFFGDSASLDRARLAVRQRLARAAAPAQRRRRRAQPSARASRGRKPQKRATSVSNS